MVNDRMPSAFSSEMQAGDAQHRVAISFVLYRTEVPENPFVGVLVSGQP